MLSVLILSQLLLALSLTSCVADPSTALINKAAVEFDNNNCNRDKFEELSVPPQDWTRHDQYLQLLRNIDGSSIETQAASWPWEEFKHDASCISAMNDILWSLNDIEEFVEQAKIDLEHFIQSDLSQVGEILKSIEEYVMVQMEQLPGEMGSVAVSLAAALQSTFYSPNTTDLISILQHAAMSTKCLEPPAVTTGISLVIEFKILLIHGTQSLGIPTLNLSWVEGVKEQYRVIQVLSMGMTWIIAIWGLEDLDDTHWDILQTQIMHHARDYALEKDSLELEVKRCEVTYNHRSSQQKTLWLKTSSLRPKILVW
ncbi:hypothetical protein EV359DRAFT_67729 [Lentinula novae-zelandiae]|nr:hypothetical protein EV359DRAFT_67729 [Lentinula novae-zelandiae]